MTDSAESKTTPLAVIANVARIVTRVTDRLAGDRSDCPLLVAAGAAEALKNFGVGANIFYGPAAWIEVMDNHSVRWAGCWGESVHFWAATEYGEIVDLNASVAHRKRVHSDPTARALYSPPMLWSREVPRFFRFRPEGHAELELHDDRDKRIWENALREITEKCQPAQLRPEGEEEFPNEPILCPGRRLLDDSAGTFKHFDRAVAVAGIPPAPPI